MAKVTASKPVSKVFYAHLYDASGVLGMVNGSILFLADTGELTVVEPGDCTFLVALGEVGLCDSQAALDKLHGGYAKLACSRLQEVA